MAQRAEPAPTLLDALARAPAAAALVVAALNRNDRRALRLAHTQLRDAVGEATTKLELETRFNAAGPARPPTARRWPRLEQLIMHDPDVEAFKALGSDTWGSLRSLRVGRMFIADFFGTPRARALAAALRRMPALRALELREVELSDDAAAALFRASSGEDVPQLRALTIVSAELSLAAARALAASGWKLEELCLRFNFNLRAAGVAALVVAPSFALRRLKLSYGGLDTAALHALARAPWPLEELTLTCNDFSAPAAGPALAALSRHASLRRLTVDGCRLTAAGFQALVEAAWPALASLSAQGANVASEGPHVLSAAAFAGFPALEELDLYNVPLGEAGARLLASQRWARLRELNLQHTQLGAAGLAALARGAWPALELLDVRHNGLGALALEDVRRWAPALVELRQGSS